MRYANHSLSLLVILIMTACQPQHEGAFKDQFRWLAGKWKGEVDGKIITESWSWDKFRYHGQSHELRGDDTVFSEHLFIENHHPYSSYIAIIGGQNPVMFNGTPSEDGLTWTFENKEHDYPSKLVYQRADDSTLVISVLGHDPGEGFSYTLKRSK